MEETFCQQLIDEYNNNCQFTEVLSVNHVASIEIPVFNTLSSLSKSELQEYIFKTTALTKNLSLTEQSLIFTILTEVLTGVIKQSDFFNTFDKNNDYIIMTLCKKICSINKLLMKDDKNVIRRNVDQMQKYSQRIDSQLLTDLLNALQQKLTSSKTLVPEYNLLEHVTNSFDKLKESVQYVDKNRNVSTKQTILEDFLQTHENLKDKTQVSLDVKSTKVLKVSTNKENVIVPNIPQKRLSNAFDIMMQASKAKKKEH